jgi:DNA-binding response OmpR family regulator
MKRVLAISKDKLFINEDSDLLLRTDLNITEKSDTQNIQNILEKDIFNSIIIDDQLLDLELYKLCQHFRSDNDTSIVLIGSKPAADIQGDLKELGVDEYLEKPVDTRALIKKICGSINLDQIEKELNAERIAKEAARLEQQRQEQLQRERERIERLVQERVIEEKEKLEIEHAEHIKQIEMEKSQLEQELQKSLKERERLEEELRECQRINKIRLEQFELEKTDQEQIKIEKDRIAQELQHIKLVKERLEHEREEQKEPNGSREYSNNPVIEKLAQISLIKKLLQKGIQTVLSEKEYNPPQ